MKAEKLCEFAVEISHRIRKRNHQHRIEPAVAPAPNRRCFPRSAAVHNHDGGLVKSRKSIDRKSTRLNSSHSQISYAVFCLKKKKKKDNHAYSKLGMASARH